MMSTGAKRMISATTRVYPTIPPMHAPTSSSVASRRGLGNIRWVPTIFALVSIGYGISAYRKNRIEKYHAQSAQMERQEAERRAREAMLMEAYGQKESLEDLQKAMETYEAQQRRQ